MHGTFSGEHVHVYALTHCIPLAAAHVVYFVSAARALVAREPRVNNPYNKHRTISARSSRTREYVCVECACARVCVCTRVSIK